MTRDLIGYAGTPPSVPWPGGATVAVSIVLNYEEGAERSIALGDATDEDVTIFGGWRSPPERRSMMKESFFEYGSRAGVWRLLDILAAEEAPATVFACGMALERNPAVAEALAVSRHEIAAHGYRWRGQIGLTPEEELAEIRRASEAIERTTGRRPVGWYSREGITETTRDLLVAEGFLYDSNAYNDDIPYYLQVGDSHHLVVPYAGDTNDARYWAPAGFATSDDLLVTLKDSLDLLLAEGERVPKMMSAGFHMRIGGRPGIAIALRRFLAYAREQQGVWIATREQIARHWIENGPAPA